MKDKGPITIYYVNDPLRKSIKEKAKQKHQLSISRLLQILSVKWFVGGIELTDEDIDKI